MSKPKVTAIVRATTTVVCSVVNLRDAVDRRLAELGESNNDAAKRSGKSAATWSRILASDTITEEQLVIVANGVDLLVTDLMERCAS